MIRWSCARGAWEVRTNRWVWLADAAVDEFGARHRAAGILYNDPGRWRAIEVAPTEPAPWEATR